MGETKWDKLATEAFGVFILAFTVISLITTRAPLAFIALAIALTLAVLVYAGGDVSGGHYNPSVTLGCWMMGLIEGDEALKYVGAQVAGGYLGAVSAFAAYGIYFNVAPAPGVSHWVVFACEALYTMWLVFTVLSSINVPSLQKGGKIGNQYYGLAIGLSVLNGASAIGGLTGGYLNPALTFGIDLASRGLGFGHSILYVGYQLVGAVLAVAIYKTLYAQALGNTSPSPQVSKLLAEFFGVAWLTLSAGLIILGGAKAGAVAIAATLTTIVYNLGAVSGAHVNPAVTASILMCGRNKISAQEAMQYIGCQLAGGVVGGLSYTMISGGKSFPLAPTAGSNMFGVWAAEIIFTFVLCLTVLACATAQNINKDMFGFLIGSCVTIGGLSSSAMSGGCLNPAVGLGIYSSQGMNVGFTATGLSNWTQYTGAELLGAACAGGAFISTHVAEYDALKAK